LETVSGTGGLYGEGMGMLYGMKRLAGEAAVLTGVVLLVPVAILAIGLPVALLVRLVMELSSRL